MPSDGQDKPCIIAIDGPAGAGKSTAARKLAEKLGLSYLDTGAMYRALTYKALTNHIDLENEEELVQLARKTIIDLENSSAGVRVMLDGQDVSKEIRNLEVTNNTFYVARTPAVRAMMVEWQRAMGSKKGIVAEGRDIGTVVFPQATRKFYLDAHVEERTHRRVKELQEKGQKVDQKKLLREVKERDQKDMARPVGPLKKAKDAIVIDSTDMTVDEVVEAMLKYIPPHG